MRHSYSDMNFRNAKIFSISVENQYLQFILLVMVVCELNSMLNKKKSFLVVDVRGIYFPCRGQIYFFFLIGTILSFI